MSWSVNLVQLACDPLLGADFLRRYNATVQLRGDIGYLIVRDEYTAKSNDEDEVRPFVEVCVSGQRFKALVDTGCTETYMSITTARALGLRLIKLRKPIGVQTTTAIEVFNKKVSRFDLEV